MNSITTALPTLGRVFNRADISPWVGTAYLLTSTASLYRSLFLSKELTSRRCSPSTVGYPISLVEKSSS